MDRLVSECEVIFHLAAAVGVQLIVRDPIRVIETNVLGTRAVLKLASRYRRKVLIASTSEVYGKGNGCAFREEDDLLLGPTTKARWCYSTSKAVDEFLGLAYHRQIGFPVVILRLFNTVGPRQTGQYGMVIPRFVQQAPAGQPPYGVWRWAAISLFLSCAGRRKGNYRSLGVSERGRKGIQHRLRRRDIDPRPREEGDRSR
jgi:UDP-glucose 4-epimerase